MSFVEVQFPVNISYGSSGGPQFSTTININHGGYEKRNSNWSYPLAQYDVVQAIKTQEQLEELICFFRVRQGKAIGFRFKDWSDYQAVGEEVAQGDGVTTDFQLIKNYTSGGENSVRIITKPVSSSYSIYVDSIIQTEVIDYNLDTASGIISFISAPSSGSIILADFEFDVPVRFDTDSISVSLDNYGMQSIETLPLIELRL